MSKITISDIILELGESPICACPECQKNGIKVKLCLNSYNSYKKNGYPKFTNHHNRRGVICSEEIRKNMSIAQKIAQSTPEARKIKSENRKKQVSPMKDKNHSSETIKIIKEKRKLQKPPTQGKHWEMPDEWKEMMSERMSGSNNPMYNVHMNGSNHWNWQGGSSFAPYCPKFNNKKKEEIRNKYNRCCILCNKPEQENLTRNGKLTKLDVHHIDYNKDQGCSNHEWRLVPLCISCHRKTNNNRELWESKICDILTIIDDK